MYLHIRFIPALIKLLRLNYSVEFFYYKIKDTLLEDKKYSNITNKKNLFDVIIQGDNLTELINNTIKTASIISQDIKLPKFNYDLLPLQIVIFDNPEVFEGIWKITPTGNILLMTKEQMPNSIPWIYGTSLIPLDPTKNIMNKIFPLRSLFIVGSFRSECFFCGSHFHDASNCPNRWIPDSKITIDYLSKTPSGSWFDDIKTMYQAGDTYGNRLENLLCDMRREFSWYFAYKINNTTSQNFNEMNKYKGVEKKENPFELIFKAMEIGDMDLLKKSLENCSNKSDTSIYPILMGLFEISQQNLDKALIFFITSENSSHNIMVKTLARLLRFRLYFINNQYEECQNLIDKIEKEWVAPLEFNYQRALLSAVTNNPQIILECMKRFFKYPRWFTLCLCEPLFLPFEDKVEKLYSSFFGELAKKNGELFDNINKFLKIMNTIFIEEKFQDFNTEFQSIESKIKRGSLNDVYEVYSELIEFKKKIEIKKKKLTSLLIERLNKMYIEVKDWIIKLPTNTRTRGFKNSCVILINDIKDISDLLFKINNQQTEELSLDEKRMEKVSKVDKEYKALKEEYPKRLKEESQKILIKESIVKASVFFFLIIVGIVLFLLLIKLI